MVGLFAGSSSSDELSSRVKEMVSQGRTAELLAVDQLRDAINDAKVAFHCHFLMPVSLISLGL